jgi:hypothetical protein
VGLKEMVLGAAERRCLGEADQGRAARGHRGSRSGRWLGEDALATAASSFPCFSSPSFFPLPSLLLVRRWRKGISKGARVSRLWLHLGLLICGSRARVRLLSVFYRLPTEGYTQGGKF